jgi:5-methylcytosine-specific restriction endonuclease McrA
MKVPIKRRPKRRHVPLYCAAWARLRAEVLAADPLCHYCKARGLTTPAREVDHIVDSREDYADDNSRENLQSLCRPCHSRKTAVSMGKASSAGCDVRGVPMDADHHWNH